VALVEGVLGADASLGERGDTASKLNLKREDRDGVDGAVTKGLLTGTEKVRVAHLYRWM
jgi:hypothetical protein